MGIKHAEEMIATMDEDMAQEEAELKDRAIKLRRQSADAFKLMTEVKKFQQWVKKAFEKQWFSWPHNKVINHSFFPLFSNINGKWYTFFPDHLCDANPPKTGIKYQKGLLNFKD